MRIVSSVPQRILVVLAVGAFAWATAACAEQPATRATPPVRPNLDVTLEAELHDDGLVVLRSPTFR
jgi:hypothetical protein